VQKLAQSNLRLSLQKLTLDVVTQKQPVTRELVASLEGFASLTELDLRVRGLPKQIRDLRRTYRTSLPLTVHPYSSNLKIVFPRAETQAPLWCAGCVHATHAAAGSRAREMHEEIGLHLDAVKSYAVLSGAHTAGTMKLRALRTVQLKSCGSAELLADLNVAPNLQDVAIVAESPVLYCCRQGAACECCQRHSFLPA